MLIRKAELQDVRAVYALICELEEQDLPLLEFENIFGSLQFIEAAGTFSHDW